VTQARGSREREKGSERRWREEAAKRKENRSRFFFFFFFFFFLLYWGGLNQGEVGTCGKKTIPEIQPDPHKLEEIQPVFAKKNLNLTDRGEAGFCPPLRIMRKITKNTILLFFSPESIVIALSL
jgi:hypothetical protein